VTPGGNPINPRTAPGRPHRAPRLVFPVSVSLEYNMERLENSFARVQN
jgi:hypothetical protein